jgi:hypothetical protein
MTIATVVTMGYGSFGSVLLVPTMGYGTGVPATFGCAVEMSSFQPSAQRLTMFQAGAFEAATFQAGAQKQDARCACD